jgi:hypothetical protein
MMQKLMEINDELVRTLAEREQLRLDQKTLQEICSMGKQRITDLQDELRKACAERDEAVEHAARLQAELATTRKQLQDVCSVKPAGQSDLVRDVSHYTEAAEVDRPTEPQPEQDGVLVQEGWWLQADGNRVYVRPTNPTASNKGKIARGYVWSDGVRLYQSDGGHDKWSKRTPHDLVKFLGKHVKTQPAEPQQSQPEPEFKPYTFAAYIVGDKSQPDALRIVWATEEWIQHSQFGIVHRMRDMQFFGNDGGCNITEYHETLTLSLEVQ